MLKGVAVDLFHASVSDVVITNLSNEKFGGILLYHDERPKPCSAHDRLVICEIEIFLTHRRLDGLFAVNNHQETAILSGRARERRPTVAGVRGGLWGMVRGLDPPILLWSMLLGMDQDVAIQPRYALGIDLTIILCSMIH